MSIFLPFFSFFLMETLYDFPLFFFSFSLILREKIILFLMKKEVICDKMLKD